jgi:hypothetical protein
VSDFHDPDSAEESEFGLGPGMIDPQNRANRVLPAEQELWEIYALPKTFDAEANGIEIGTPDTTPVPRLLPGETEADRA